MDSQVAALLANRDIGTGLKTGRLVGIGGNGAVYELSVSGTTDISVDHVVKLVIRDVNSRSSRSQRREIVQWPFLDHKNILRCDEVGAVTTGSLRVLYLVLERAESTLEDRIRAAKLSVHEALDLLRSMTSAVSCLHQLGLIHRDIKPQNILRVGGTWKLSDFGLIRDVGDLSRKYTKGFQGTMFYAAPEVLRSTPRMSRKSDIYSLALVIFQSFYGVRYAPSEDDSKLLQDADSGEQDLALLALTLSKCLHVSPQQRPTADELSALLGIETVTTFEDGLPEVFSIGTGRFRSDYKRADSDAGYLDISIEEIFEAGMAWGSLAIAETLSSLSAFSPEGWSSQQDRLLETINVFHVSLFGSLVDKSDISGNFETRVKEHLVQREHGAKLVAWFDLGALIPTIVAMVLARQVKAVQQLTRRARSAIVSAGLTSNGMVEALRLVSLISQLVGANEESIEESGLSDSAQLLNRLLLAEAGAASGRVTASEL